MITIRHFEDTIVVSLNKIRRIDFLVFARLKRHLLQIIENSSGDVYFDLNDVLFIDSNSFSGLKSVNEVALKNGIKLSFINVSDEVIELFDLVNENNIFRVYSKNEMEHLLVMPV